MTDLLNALNKLLETIAKMAGGKRKATIVFWVVFLIGAGISLKPFWDSISYIGSKLAFTSPIVTGLVSMVILLLGMIALFLGITIMAAIPAQLLRSTFDSGYRVRLNDTFVALLVALREAEKETHSPQIKDIIESTEILFERWQKNKTNILVNWIAWGLWSKDTSKWKLVRINDKCKNKEKSK